MGCMGSGPARCKKCARGYSLKGAKCLGKDILILYLRKKNTQLCHLNIFLLHTDIDECIERAVACPGLNEACINEEGSFHCDCADGFIRRDSICVENKPPSKYL